MAGTYTFEEILSIRDVRSPCPACTGFGVVVYGSTATWRGGIGGASMTAGVCDKCWGSGDRDRPWPSHRHFEALKRADADNYAKVNTPPGHKPVILT